MAASTDVVGRDDLLGRLRDVVDSAAAGHGRALMLTGAAGIGKTTLLAEAARHAARRGLRVAWACGSPDDGAPGYWLWTQALRALGLATPQGATARYQLFDEVASTLVTESRVRPLLLLLDDLQWADASSVLLLDFLVRRLPSGAIAVIGAHRDGRPATGWDVVPVTGLPVEAVAAMLGTHTSRAAAVWRRTGGNPFFVRQVAWLGTDTVPAAVRDVLAERFAALDPECRALLPVAAAIGRSFPVDLLTEVAGGGDVRAARRAGLLTADGFAHDLLREYAYARLPDPAAVHHRIGVALERRGAPAAELAGHFRRADPHSERARRYSVVAARAATAALAYDEAVTHWAHAATDSPDLVLELGHAQRRAGDLPAAASTFQRVVETGDGRAAAAAALALAEIGARTGWSPNDLVDLLSRAADGVGERDPLRPRVLASLATLLAWHRMDPGRAETLSAEAIRLARQLGDRSLLATCLLARHDVRWAPGTAAERRALAAEVVALTDDPESAAQAHLLAATDLLELGDPAFRAELDEFLRIADGGRQPRLRYAALVRRGMLALLAGRLTDAERLVDRAAALGAELGEPGAADVHFDQRWVLADALGRRGELVDAAGDAFPDPDSPRARCCRALALLAAGDKASAAAAVAPLVAGDIGDGEPPAGGPGPGGHGELLDAVHRAEMAAELAAGLDIRSFAEHAYATLLPYAELTVVSGAAVSFRGAVAHHLGVLARMLGRSSAAAAHLACAVAVHERLGATTWTLRSRFELARTTSPSVCAEIADHARRLGMAGLVRDATPAFHRSGARWTLSYGGLTAHLRDSKGLADLAVLLSRPGRTVSAADLVAGGDRHAHGGLSPGAGDVLDRAARERLRARLRDLDEEITEARDWSDHERVARATAERDDLLAALASATGQGSRPRRPGEQDERARKAVTARIRDALGRIERVHPALGAHLSQSVSTGRLCCYAPKTPVTWRT